MALDLLDLDTQGYGRAGKARHSERALIAAQEHRESCPQPWSHIGIEMRKDAPHRRIVRRPRYSPKPTPFFDRLIQAVTYLITGERP